MGTMNFGRTSYTSPQLELVAFVRVGLLKLGPPMLTPRQEVHGELCFLQQWEQGDTHSEWRVCFRVSRPSILNANAHAAVCSY